ncbi:MAG: hypothetical protein CENE_01056 [Candidatus Celerinatantimonas neptuna]|nr:MAG: hypothetical protein CENE_01056 [Candidatus Celerinatantimonas neptuna]
MKIRLNLSYTSSALFAGIAVIILLALLFQWNNEHSAMLRIHQQFIVLENARSANLPHHRVVHKGTLAWLMKMPLTIQRLDIRGETTIVYLHGHFQQLVDWLQQYDKQTGNYRIRQMTITTQNRTGVLKIVARLIRR